MKIFDELFETEELKKQPPVLIDVGASGFLHPEWKDIAKYCVCISFDADEREFSYIEKKESEFQRLYVFNCIVSDRNTDEMDFYLTKSPYCSSTLQPDNTALEDWLFWKLFLVEKKIKLKSRSIISVLNELKIDYVDWFKTDSQGTDLKVFQNIGDDLINNVIIADFEPGIIKAYEGEDKLHEILSYMENYPFWLAGLNIKGTQRMNKFLTEKYADKLNKVNLIASPGWGEMSYMNNFRKSIICNKRNVFAGWIFATIKKQHGFALELLVMNEKIIDAEIFKKLYEHSEQQIFSTDAPSVKQLIKRKIINYLNKF